MGNLIVKDNALIEASHKLSEVEQRLILLAILKARSVGDTVQQLKDKMLEIHADDYIQAFNVDRDASYLALKKAVLGLYRAEWGYKYINDRGNIIVRYERFTQSAEYVDGEGTVRFMFSTAIIPMLVELERNFTTYEIGQVASLTSRYAMRLYEMIMRHFDKQKGKGMLRISLDELRFRLGLLPTEYKAMSDFKKYVFDLAIKQINEKTDINISYEQQKKGRIITGFEITSKYKASIKTAKKKKENTDKDPNTPDIFTGKTEHEKNRPIVVEALTIPQAKKYATALKLHPDIVVFYGSLADENAYYQKVFKALTEPDEVNKEAQQAVFTALWRDTDYKK